MWVLSRRVVSALRGWLGWDVPENETEPRAGRVESRAWINRGFRLVKPGGVSAFRADEWDARPLNA